MDRALAILALFTDAQPRLRVAEVCARLGIGDSMASRLLARLEAHGLVEREAVTGFYAEVCTP